uniref:hypothetical protein n=1 Tax=Herpetosiphon llansteffanensis TaxID=2094568 RepID=UPI0013E042B4
ALEVGIQVLSNGSSYIKTGYNIPDKSNAVVQIDKSYIIHMMARFICKNIDPEWEKNNSLSINKGNIINFQKDVVIDRTNIHKDSIIEILWKENIIDINANLKFSKILWSADVEVKSSAYFMFKDERIVLVIENQKINIENYKSSWISTLVIGSLFTWTGIGLLGPAIIAGLSGIGIGVAGGIAGIASLFLVPGATLLGLGIGKKASLREKPVSKRLKKLIGKKFDFDIEGISTDVALIEQITNINYKIDNMKDEITTIIDSPNLSSPSDENILMIEGFQNDLFPIDTIDIIPVSLFHEKKKITHHIENISDNVIYYGQSGNESYITDIMIIQGRKNIEAPRGYTRVENPLYIRPDGRYVYLCYTRGSGLPIIEIKSYYMDAVRVRKARNRREFLQKISIPDKVIDGEHFSYTTITKSSKGIEETMWWLTVRIASPY